MNEVIQWVAIIVVAYAVARHKWELNAHKEGKDHEWPPRATV